MKAQNAAQSEQERPTFWRILLLWARVSTLSFGGGAATILLIQREFVERRGWLTEEEYQHYWSLSQLAPGIILVAMVILMGRKLAGWPGIAASLIGMLVPSAIITCIISALIGLGQMFSPIQAIFRGVIPATAGLLFAIAAQFFLPAWKESKHSPAMIECLVITAGSIIALAWFHIEIIYVFPAAILLSLGVFLPLQLRSERRHQAGEQP